MTHAIHSLRTEPGATTRREPRLPAWVVPRARLADRLDLGVAGRLTLVSGPPGWGKTLAVSSWAAHRQAGERVLWLSAAGAAADPDLFLDLLGDRLAEEGVRCPRLPEGGSRDAVRTRVLAGLGRSLRRSGPWVLVLDDYPTGDVAQLGADLEVVLHHAQAGLALVVISHGLPALATQRHHLAGDLTRIAVPDLAMDRYEVADVLARHDVDAGELTARTVTRHTGGWACGVRLAALALRESSTLEAAMAASDRASVDFLTSEVLGKVPAPTRELLVRTSMVADVSQDLARAVLGPSADLALTPDLAHRTFVELRGDRSFRCPPLLRAAALEELAREPRSVSQEATRRAAQWHVDQDEVTAGLEIAITAGDWPWVGRALVEAYVVPQLLAGAVSGTVDSALAMAPVRAAEPLLEAATTLRRGGRTAVESTLAILNSSVAAGTATPAAELSEAFLRLVVARARGDLHTGRLMSDRVRGLVRRLPRERQGTLVTLLEAHEGALATTAGDLTRAEATLRHAADEALSSASSSAPATDCLAQLALLDAYRDNLRAAERRAAAVLKGADGDPGQGTAYAHLATAWVHIERAEPALARQHLDRATEDSAHTWADPWLHTALLLAQARWLIATDQPETALRLLTPALRETKRGDGWRVAVLSVASAHALVAMGEPREALQVAGPGPGPTSSADGVLTARALLALGDRGGARAAVSEVVPHLAGAPVGVQVEGWLLEARLSEAAERTRLLVDRALRVATPELLRRPFVQEAAWLLPLVEQDPVLRRAHGGFLARLALATSGPTSGRGMGQSRRAPEGVGSAPLLVETLTVREAQVLGLLAEMCSTEEIARELFLSVNTVKTYVRGILRKLSVNRRVDAVRRGRELGLC